MYDLKQYRERKATKLDECEQRMAKEMEEKAAAFRQLQAIEAECDKLKA